MDSGLGEFKSATGNVKEINPLLETGLKLRRQGGSWDRISACNVSIGGSGFIDETNIVDGGGQFIRGIMVARARGSSRMNVKNVGIGNVAQTRRYSRTLASTIDGCGRSIGRESLSFGESSADVILGMR